MDFSLEESYLSRTIIENSDQRILVADSSQHLRKAPVRTGTLSDVDRLVTDQLTTPMAELCEAAGVELLY